MLFIVSSYLFLACDTVDDLEKLNNQVFLKLYGGIGSEEGKDFIQLPDGGFVIVGYTSSYTEDDRDIFVVRTDQNGNEIWSNRYGDNLINIGNSVILTDNNTLIVCGETIQVNGRRDILIKEIDLDGNELNSLTHGEIDSDEYGTDIIKAISDGYLILGNSVFGNPINPDSAYFYLLEVDENLIVKPNRDRPFIGDKNNFNQGMAVSIYQGQEYLCFGTTKEGGVNAPPGSNNFYIFKIGEIGDATNTQNFFGTNLNEIGTSLAKISGGYLLTGYQINGNRHIPYLVKVNDDLALNPVWQNTFDVPYNSSVISRTPTSVIETMDGNIVILMNSDIQPFGSEIGLMKINSSGQDVIWENSFGSNNNDKTGGIIELRDGQFVMCGSIGFGEENNEEINKMGLFKTNPFGELIPL